MKTVIGLFKDYGSAEHTLGEFAAMGLGAQHIGMLAPAGHELKASTPMSVLDLPGLGQVCANGPMLRLLDAINLEKSRGSMEGALEKIGLGKDEAAQCVDGIKHGGTLEAVVVEDQKEAEALAIMRRHSAGTRERLLDGELVIPIVREELRVGKREVEAGGVRIETHVKSVPVDETVTIREEHIRVERRVVDRTIGQEDEAFREREIELKATSEQPTFEKRARVVEEIRLHKDMSERIERIHDDLRHTDVQISEIPAGRLFEASRYEEHFKKTFESEGFTLASLAPAYEYGERLRHGTSGSDWSKIEATARTLWEGKNPGTWDRFREAIRAGWNMAGTH